MSAKEKDLEIEDDLARGEQTTSQHLGRKDSLFASAEDPTGLQSKDLQSVEEELRSRKRRSISGLEDRATDTKPYGFGRGLANYLTQI